MMLNCFGFNKLHGFIMHSIMLAVGRISHENYYSFQFSNVGSYANKQISITFNFQFIKMLITFLTVYLLYLIVESGPIVFE